MQRTMGFEFAIKKAAPQQPTRDAFSKRLATGHPRTLRGRFGELVKQLKFLDESWAHLGLTHLCGRAAPGQQVVEATPGYLGPHHTLVATLGLEAVAMRTK